MSDYMDFDEENHTPERQLDEKGMSDKQILNYSGLYLSLMTIAVFASQVVVSYILGRFFSDYLEAGWVTIALTAIGVAGVGLPVFYILMKRLPDSKRGEGRRLSLIQFIGYFIVCVAAMYISNFITLFINAIIEIVNGVEIVNPVEELILNSNMLLTMLYASIVAPIVEELIFRKLLLDKLRRLGDLPAILITGIAFGLFHMNLSQFFYAAVLGFILAYVVIRTNRIIYSILLHMMMNFVGAGIAPLVLAKESVLGMTLMALWVYGAMTVGAVLMIINGRKVVLNKAENSSVKWKDYILNPGILSFIVICAIFIIRSVF